ncbi:MAG: response regulator [Candidatus Omnitrophica bacterium]|nr:response regulator [Candidatus Omnitrophota bacterium]
MKTVLIIDDEEDLTFFVKANLELSGNYKVVVANSGKEGLKLAEKIKPDAILLDIMMPHMDGFEVLAKLKKSLKTLSIPVVMLSAKGDEDTKIQAASAYDEDYVVKPVQIDFLEKKLNEILSRF